MKEHLWAVAWRPLRRENVKLDGWIHIADAEHGSIGILVLFVERGRFAYCVLRIAYTLSDISASRPVNPANGRDDESEKLGHIGSAKVQSVCFDFTSK